MPIIMRLRVAGACLAMSALTLPAWGQDIVIGQSVPLSGSNADIGRQWVDLTILARGNRFVH